MKIITILNFKGGVGKSETTRNLAKGLVDQGYRVLIVDNDPQANTTRTLNGSITIDELDLNQIKNEEDLINAFIGNDDTLSLEDLLTDPTNTKEAILHTNVNKLDLLPCSLKLANTDTSLRLDSSKPQHNRLKKILSQIKSEYDYCLIDCPPILNLLTVNALVASNSDCIIPIKIDFAGLQGWSMTVKYLESLKEGFDLDINYKVVFTMVTKTSHGWFKSGEKIISLFQNILPGKTLDTIIRNQSAPVINSGFKNEFVVDDKNANVGKDYRKLAEEIRGIYQ